MDRLITKIRDLESDAVKLNLATKQVHSGSRVSCTQEECPDCGSEEWIQVLRRNAGEWNARPLVVLSLFDGIGGVWTALTMLGIPFVGYSCEVLDAAIQVTKARYPTVRHVGDILELDKNSIPDKIDLIVGGFPCQDLSSLGHKMGLHGQRSRLFFEMLRIYRVFKPKWFLAENVASMTWIDRQEITKHLNTNPIEIDSEELTASKRKRMYWSNIPYPKRIPQIRDSECTSLQSVLKNATALDKKVGCILSQNNSKGGHGSLELVMDNATGALRYISVMEVELAMGYPPGYTNVKFQHSDNKAISPTVNHRTESCEEIEITRFAGEKILRSKKVLKTAETHVEMTRPVTPVTRPVADGLNRHARWGLLGNTFSVPVISYLLSPLLEPTARVLVKPITLPKSVREEDCSAMDPGEVWALYNSHERPNWYALIVSRSGDRFCQMEGGKKRPPIYIEVKFMEMTPAYAAREVDEWDTNRGTGLFNLRDLIDKQNSWVAFSHRVTNFLKFDDHYFIYPGKDEVWAIYDNVAKSRYLVYVLESYIDHHKAKQGKPGKESFFAHCRLLQRKELELYRFLDKEIDYTDLAVFAFRAPFHYKNEGTLLRIELTMRQRKQGTDNDRHYRRRKRGSDSESEEQEDLELEDGDSGDMLEEDDTAIVRTRFS